jgi:hypothetical protein
VAEPPQNADPDVRLRYNEWGQVEGRAKGGVSRAVVKPDDVGARSSVEYLWSRRPDLDSLNHCRLGEWVVLRLNGKSTSHCEGRHRPTAAEPTGGNAVAAARERPKSIRFPRAFGALTAKNIDAATQVVGKTGLWSAGVEYVDAGGTTQGMLGVMWMESDTDWAKVREEVLKTRARSSSSMSELRPGQSGVAECDEDGDVGALVAHGDRMLFLLWWGRERLRSGGEAAAARRLADVSAAKDALFDQIAHMAAKPPADLFR